MKRDSVHTISDNLWEKIKPLLLPVISNGSSARMDDRQAMDAILFVLHKEFDWGSLPSDMVCKSIVYERFREWQKSGLFQRMWKAGLLTYDELEKLVWYGRR